MKKKEKKEEEKNKMKKKKKKEKKEEEEEKKRQNTGETIKCKMNMNLKVIPLQVWTGLESSRSLERPYFVTTAQGGGKVVSFTHRPPLPPGNIPSTHFC